MRNVTSAWQTAIAQSVIRPVLFFEFQMAGGMYLRYWTGAFDVSWNGNTWQTAGQLKGLGTITESIDKDTAVTATLMGEPTALLSTIIGNVLQNGTGKIWLGMLDTNYNIIADPHLLYVGKLSTCELDDDINEATVALGYDAKLVPMRDPKDYRYNQECQQIFYPGDTGFEYVEQLTIGFSGYWGKKKDAPTKAQTGKKNAGKAGKGKK